MGPDVVSTVSKANGEEPTDIYVDPSDNTLRYVYRSKSTHKSDTKPLVLIAGCTCPYPKENFPYQQPVFEYLKIIGSLVQKYSNRYGVPPLAVAGSIADEYNTRFMPDYGGLKKYVDHQQDDVIPYPVQPKGMYNPAPDPTKRDDQLNDKIEKGYQALKKNDPDNSRRRSTFDRAWYFEAAGDYGKGNISVRTAIDLHDKYPAECTRMTRAELLRYLVTNEGTVQYAALTIREGQQAMAEHLQSLPSRKREAALVSYYKEGLSFYNRYLSKHGNTPNNKIQPGDGCRVCFQRKQIGDAIGVTVHALEPVIK